jgi:hypothetical protein
MMVVRKVILTYYHNKAIDLLILCNISNISDTS